jgi:hypothetical protein
MTLSKAKSKGILRTTKAMEIPGNGYNVASGKMTTINDTIRFLGDISTQLARRWVGLGDLLYHISPVDALENQKR